MAFSINFFMFSVIMAYSGVQAWKERFDGNDYLRTYYDRDLFTPNRFMGDYFLGIAREMHRLMDNRKCAEGCQMVPLCV